MELDVSRISATASPPSVTPKSWTGRSPGGAVGYQLFAQIIRLIGLRCSYQLLPPLAICLLLTSPTARRASLSYRRRLGLYCGNRWHDLLGAYRHFLAIGKLLLDRVAMLTGQIDLFDVDFDGREHLVKALDSNRGLLIISAHIGNWVGAAQVLTQLNQPVNLIAYEGENEGTQQAFQKLLMDRQFRVISSNNPLDASITMLNRLARGEIVLMHADRNLGTDGRLADFLGAPARFPPGPFTIAALSGASIMSVFGMREAPYKYRLVAYPAEMLTFRNRNDREREIDRWVQTFATRLEEVLRRYPLQWCNFYEFWETNQSV